MELPFELFGFTQFIENKPSMMAMVASFGVLIAAFIIILLARLPLLKILIRSLAGGLALALFPGFIVCILFSFSGISGLHIFFSWAVIVIASIMFVLFNYARMASLLDDMTSMKEKEAQMSKVTSKKRVRKRGR